MSALSLMRGSAMMMRRRAFACPGSPSAMTRSISCATVASSAGVGAVRRRSAAGRRAGSPTRCRGALCGVGGAFGEDRLGLVEGVLFDQRLVCGVEDLLAPADAAEIGAQATPGRSTRAPHARVPTLTPPPDGEQASIVPRFCAVDPLDQHLDLHDGSPWSESRARWRAGCMSRAKQEVAGWIAAASTPIGCRLLPEARRSTLVSMANHKRRRPKQRRSGCLLCKPQKLSSVKKAERRRGRRDALLHELRAVSGGDR